MTLQQTTTAIIRFYILIYSLNQINLDQTRNLRQNYILYLVIYRIRGTRAQEFIT